jgi:hypothetical protein
MPMKRSILYLALFFGVLRAILLFYNNPYYFLNIDEESNYEVATNHYKGRGYTYFDPKKSAYLPTAFHASFTIFLYENLLLKNNIHKRYWVMFCNIVSGLLLGLSIFYFYQLSLLFVEQKLAYYCTFAYCIFPSVLYYIGTLFWYEQMVLSLLIICIYLIIKSFKQKLSIFELIAMAVCIILTSLLRIQTIAIFAPLLAFTITVLLYKKQFQKSLIYISIAMLALVSHFPSLQKNKLIYGKYILSTQIGYEILQGHNPYAKGSWMGDWPLPSSALYRYSHKKINNLKNLNQFEEGLARKKVALDWIKENPLDEIKLIFRKLLLFFLPRNFEFLPYNQFLNPITLIIYLGFLGYLFISIRKKLEFWDVEKTILIMPIIGAIGLTLVFFMGARWRYYAEPFMIIFAFMFLQQVWPSLNLLKNKFDGFQK